MGIFPLVPMATLLYATLSFISSDDTPLVDIGVPFRTGGAVAEGE